jgi:dienelactone hydrolase
MTLAACGGKSAAPVTTRTTTTKTGLPRLSFDEGKGPVDYVDKGVVHRVGKIAIHDVSFLSQDHRVAGYLVDPGSASKHPAIVLVHGSGGTRDELLPDAIVLASRGAVALTITAPSSASPPPAPTTADQLLSGSRAVVVEDVVAVRRAADVLQSLPDVDANRLGYLGWSAGAKTGAFVAASDPRFGALALLSGGAATLADFVKAAPPAIRAKARTVLGSVDPLRYLSLAKPGTVLLEDGQKDTVVPHSALENFIQAAPHGTVVHWYPAGHALNATAYRTAFTWLLQTLGS